MKNKSPFKFEKERQKFASEKKLELLKKSYDSRLSEIQDLNSSKFWDERISSIIEYDPPDGMTKDRIDTAYNFMPKDTKRILDIGAGYGYVEKLISKNNKIEIFGNDISRNAIKNLRKRFNGNFRLESIYSLKYPKNYFDVVFALEVIEHVPPSKVMKLYADIKRILKKDGYLILSIPTNEALDKMSSNPNGHTRMYTKDLIQAELEIAGFKTEKIKTFSAFKSLYQLKKIISKFFPHRWEPNDIIVKAKSV